MSRRFAMSVDRAALRAPIRALSAASLAVATVLAMLLIGAQPPLPAQAQSGVSVSVTVAGQTSGPLELRRNQVVPYTVVISGIIEDPTLLIFDLIPLLHSEDYPCSSCGGQFARGARLGFDQLNAENNTVTYNGSFTVDSLTALRIETFEQDQIEFRVDGTMGKPPTFTSVDEGAIFGPISLAPDAGPVARDQSVTTAEDTALPINVDASDPDGDAIDSVAVTTGPAHGIISVSGTVITYTPNANFTGADSFTYTVAANGKTSNEATVTIAVSDQTAPVFTSLPNVTVPATSNYGAVVTYALPTATDNATTPTVSCLPASGSQYPIGTTTVTCTASDGVNVTTGTFVVTVTNSGFRDPRDPRPGASPQTQPPPTPTPRPTRPPRG